MARKKRVREPELSAFIRQYRRKRQKGGEPNDRAYDRKLEAKIKRMRPEDVDKLIRGTEEDAE
jgi:hypothetical protein